MYLHEASYGRYRKVSQNKFDYWNFLFVTIVFIVSITCFALQSNIALIFGTIFNLIYFLSSKSSSAVDRKLFNNMLIMSVLFFPAFFKPSHGFSPVFYLIATYVSILTAHSLAQCGIEIVYRALRFTFYFFSAIIAVILYIYWGYPEPFAQVIEGSSTNGIPAYLVVLQIAFSLSSYLARGRLPLIAPIITALVAFYGSGRGSIVVAALIIFGTLAFNMMPREMSTRRRISYLLISASLAGVLVANFSDLFDFVSRFTKLSVGLVDTNRLDILDAYLATITPYTFVMGSQYDGTLIDYLYFGNPHISYIRTHSFFGIFVTLLAVLSPLYIFLMKGHIRDKIVFFCFLGLMLVRAATEPILFPTLLDLFYFLGFFLFAELAKKNSLILRR